MIQLDQFQQALINIVDQSIINTYTNADGEYTNNGVRSGKQRTKPAHEALIALMSQMVAPETNTSFVCEYKIQEDSFGSTFDVDIAIIRDDKVIGFIPVKIVNGDYNRNRNTYLNISQGETNRILAPRPDGSPAIHHDAKILFVNFIPYIQADYNNANNLLRYAHTNCRNIDHILSYMSNGQASNVDIMYDNQVNKADAELTTTSRGALSQKGEGAQLLTKQDYFNQYNSLPINERMNIVADVAEVAYNKLLDILQ